jgi:uncharacterized protein YutE (UPF0331/DUF86 family)
MSGMESERPVLDLIIPALTDAGYEVYTHPSRQLLPSFMGDYVPDAIALGKPKNLAIEIVRDGTRSGSRKRVADRFLGVTDWELRIYYARSGGGVPAIDGVTPDIIDRTITKVEALIAAGQMEAALLLGWSTFEAIGRALIPNRLSHSQSPARLIEQLAGEGIVTPDEADRLRPIANLRNAVAHGALQRDLDRTALEDFVATLKLVLHENQPVGAGA